MYVGACNVACAQSGFMESMCTVKNEMPFTREIADQSTFIGACCNTDGHFNFNRTC